MTTFASAFWCADRRWSITGVYTGVPAVFRPAGMFSPNADGTLPDRTIVIDIFKEYPIGNSRSWLPKAIEEDGLQVTPLLETPQVRVLQVSPRGTSGPPTTLTDRRRRQSGHVLQDLRYAFRSLAKRPGFAAIAVITLSLGIGATTAIFSVVQAVLLRPLEYPDADRLVKVVGFDKAEGTTGNLSPADFLDFQRDATSFERMGANGWVGLATISGGRGEAERAGWVQVTEGFFPTLQMQPAVGRGFRLTTIGPARRAVALISDGFWRRRFGADPSIVGQSISFNAMPVTVIGVLPPHFRHLEINPERAADIFTPFRWDTAQPNRGGHFIRGVARLRTARRSSRARAELDTIAARLEQQYPSRQHRSGRARRSAARLPWSASRSRSCCCSPAR